jgi:branched-chain amino acid transport system permease protein
MTLPCGVRNYKYDTDMAIVRTKAHWVLFIGFLIVLFTVPLYMGNYWLGVFNLIGITIISATGLNILIGYCGQLSIGHMGFMAVGAYTSAILTTRFEMPFLVGLIAAGTMSGLVGIVFGLPSIRVKGFYLAISTIAAQFIIMWIISQWGWTGGQLGMTVPFASIGGFVFRSGQSQYFLIIGITVLMVFFAKNLVRTKVGRAFIAIRDNDLAAEVMGISLIYYKLLAFFIGCFYAGIAGSLFAHWNVSLTPEQFSFTDSILYVGMIIIGGLGTSVGPIFGVVFIRMLKEILTVNIVPFLEKSLTMFPSGFATGVTPMVFGLVIVLFLILEPRGIAHRWNLFKASYRLWPFSY